MTSSCFWLHTQADPSQDTRDVREETSNLTYLLTARSSAEIQEHIEKHTPFDNSPSPSWEVDVRMEV